MNQYSYMDPGQTENKALPYGQRWGDEPASPAGDWAQRGAQAWIQAFPAPTHSALDQYAAGNTPSYGDVYGDVNSVAPMFTAAGPVRAVRSPIAGGMRTVLEYFKDANPTKTLGELSYSKLSGQAPVFENIVSSGPRATGELMHGLQTRLGPMLDSMEITNIQPQAVDFWDKVSGRLGNYPNLQQRVSDEVQRVRNAWGSVPENSYQANPYKNFGYFE